MFTDQQITCLVNKYIDTVFRLALSYTNHVSDAEDITQEVFFALFREKKLFENEDHIRHWLIRVTVNMCKNYFRAPWRKHLSLEEYASTSQDMEDLDKDILRMVMELPLKYRMPIYLYYFEEYSTQEIAKILKIPKGTVCTNLARGREALKLQLMEDESGE